MDQKRVSLFKWLVSVSNCTLLGAALSLPLKSARAEDQGPANGANSTLESYTFAPNIELSPNSRLSSKGFLPPITKDHKITVREGHLTLMAAPTASQASGPRIRLVGVNLSGQSTHLNHQQTDVFVARLVNSGVNWVRIVQHQLYNPETKKLTQDQTVIDNFFYLLSQLRQNGIYYSLAIFNGDFFSAGEDAKPGTSAAQLMRDLFRLRPRGQLALKDDPALALVEVSNEDSLVQLVKKQGRELGIAQNQREKIQSEYQSWAKTHKSESPDASFMDFLQSREQAICTRALNVLRQKSGVTAPLACSEPTEGEVAGLRRESPSSFTEAHVFWDNQPTSHNFSYSFIHNSSMLKYFAASTLKHALISKIAGKPFLLSEYDHLSNNDFSAETLPFATGFTLNQDWDGFALFRDSGGITGSSNGPSTAAPLTVDQDLTKAVFLPLASRILLNDQNNYLSKEKRLIIQQNAVTKLMIASNDSLTELWGKELPEMLQNPLGQLYSAGFSDSGESAHIDEIHERKGTPASLFRWLSTDRPELQWRSSYGFGFVGYAHGQKLKLANLQLHLADSGQFVSILAASLDKKELETSRFIGLAVVGQKIHPTDPSPSPAAAASPMKLAAVNYEIEDSDADRGTSPAVAKIDVLDAHGLAQKNIDSENIDDATSWEVSQTKNKSPWVLISR